jgi:hypothetical protein
MPGVLSFEIDVDIVCTVFDRSHPVSAILEPGYQFTHDVCFADTTFAYNSDYR